MRFWLVTGLVVLVAFFAVKSCGSKLLPSKSSLTPSSDSSSSVSSSSGSPSVSVPPDDGKIAISVIHRFLHRPAPLASDLQSLVGSASGCSFAVDAVTGSVCVTGPSLACSHAKRYLESIDLALPSCVAQCWAVYVDSSVQKGFDLTTMIGAVVGKGISGTFGNGSATLNFSASDIAMALNVICDGETVEVVQRPYIQLLSGVPASIEATQDVPIPQTSVSQGISQSSVIYRKVGLQLEIVPSFFSQDQVRLAIKQQNGLIGRNVKIDNNEIPIIQSQGVTAAVEMTVGQTVILGGVSTLRERHVSGFLRDGSEVSTGSLWVIVSTDYGVPCALPVGSPGPASRESVPLLPPVDDSRMVLPPKGWQKVMPWNWGK